MDFTLKSIWIYIWTDIRLWLRISVKSEILSSTWSKSIISKSFIYINRSFLEVTAALRSLRVPSELSFDSNSAKNLLYGSKMILYWPKSVSPIPLLFVPWFNETDYSSISSSKSISILVLYPSFYFLPWLLFLFLISIFIYDIYLNFYKSISLETRSTPSP